MRKAGNQLRITLQLIDVATQAHVLSREYNREMKDVFAIQAEVAQQVAEALKVTLGAAEHQQLARTPLRTSTLTVFTCWRATSSTSSPRRG